MVVKRTKLKISLKKNTLAGEVYIFNVLLIKLKVRLHRLMP